ncbi:hypothetical protein Tco_0372335, partial [Tanacetum coccineum]
MNRRSINLTLVEIVSSVLIEVISSVRNCFDYLHEDSELEENQERPGTHTPGTQLCSTAFTGVEAGVWFFLSRINARTISLSSATSDETARVEEL